MILEIDMGTIAVLHQGAICTKLAHWLRQQPSELCLVTPQGNQIPRQRNMAVHAMQGDWLFFIDSDCAPPVDVLPRLLSHNVPLVGGVVLERYSPFYVAATKSLEPAEKWRADELPKDGLLPVPAMGTGCLLVRREVFDAVPEPWFKCGQLIPDCLTEDTEFCLRASEAGFPVYLDCGVRVFHRMEGYGVVGRDGKMWIEWPGATDTMMEIPRVRAHGGRVATLS